MGTLVTIYGLKDKPELNGSFGNYMGPAEKTSCFLERPMGSLLVASLAAVNFVKTKVVASTKDMIHWMRTCTTCAASNFLHGVCDAEAVLRRVCKVANSSFPIEGPTKRFYAPSPTQVPESITVVETEEPASGICMTHDLSLFGFLQ